MSAQSNAALKSPVSPTGVQPKKIDLCDLVASAHSLIPPSVEYALLTYISEGHPNEKTVRDIVAAYQSGNLAGARILIDGLDGTIDGRFGTLMLEGTDATARPSPTRPAPEVE